MSFAHLDLEVYPILPARSTQAPSDWPLMALWSLSPGFGLSWLNALDLQPLIAELQSRFPSMLSMSSLHSSLLSSDHRFCFFFEEHPVVLRLPSIEPGISIGEQVPGDLPKYTHHTWPQFLEDTVHVVSRYTELLANGSFRIILSCSRTGRQGEKDPKCRFQ